jgi:ABC-type transport system involved in multi-copper enzyme maturation permease subunit
MTTVTPFRSQAGPVKGGFRQELHAEWTKFRTVRGWIIAMLVAVLVIVGLGLFAAGGSGSSCQVSTGQSATGHNPASASTTCPGTTFPVGPGGEPVTDDFYFVHQPLAGNGSITVRVTSLSGLLPANVASGSPGTKPGLLPWSKAGIIIKDGTSQGSAYAAMTVTGANGVRMQWNYTHDTPGLAGSVSAASPRWLRLVRTGATITGYDSDDGTHWAQVGTASLAGLPSTVQAGLFATSPDDQSFSQTFGGTNGQGMPTQDTAVFDHVSLSSAPAGAWAGGYVGEANMPGVGGYHQAGGRFAVTGSGDIAPIVPGPTGNAAGPTPSVITIYLIGTFAGLVVVIVVAVMFMTAEYRRGLIRITLSASPRRGRVLAAKALVIGAAGFVAGLVAAAAAVLGAVRLAQSRGQAAFPVSWPTDVRVIVGTAALVAVAAVLALALGAMLRRSVGAVTLVIAVVVVPYFLAATAALPAGAAEWLLRITPAAGFAVQQAAPRYAQVSALYTPASGYPPLAPWAGLAVLCGWTVLALGGAAYLLRRRDA